MVLRSGKDGWGALRLRGLVDSKSNLKGWAIKTCFADTPRFVRSTDHVCRVCCDPRRKPHRKDGVRQGQWKLIEERVVQHRFGRNASLESCARKHYARDPCFASHLSRG